jgi:AAHS family 4-hydroxybenzoate transporter-like MFS transporter
MVTVALCWLALLAEGFDSQSMGVAAPSMGPALHIARDQLGPAFSASTVGTLIGAIALGQWDLFSPACCSAEACTRAM